ncbi:MAG: peptidoglycan-binding domain-containing protein, partial [Candidatus Staskawiczbacteria bacterium]|nr:peptidoglycan-binding domain-containing protein [Candidatus Staskawiczbacteria bacterium]
MSIKRTIIAAVVGLTLVAMVAPGVAQGVTIDELLAQIAVLQAQLLALQGGSGGTPVPTGIVACSGVTFTRSLVIGSTGQDVKCAQVLLNNNGYTLAQSGAGSPGMETSYFGPITLAAVRTFQMAKGWTPANQVGPLTRAALNALISSTPGTPGTPGTPIPAGAGLTVALASTNPAAGTIVDGQAQFPLARLIFTNGDNAEVTVTGLKAQRIGVSADASVANVYLFNGATRLTDGASVSSTRITFNDSTGLFKVPAYGTVTITVTADVDGTAGE